jgi:pyruvate/2-oxoglutarate dehydrogenase complex dihydrolipoamide acyltransferase (E2) component
MPKKFDPKAKARKQKIVAAVLGVLLLGVLAYQAPTILGLFGGGSSTTQSEPAPATPAAPAAPAAGTPATPASAAPVAGSAQLVDSDVAPTPGTGQLVTFDRFESKDPFVPQVGKNDGSGGQPAPDDTAPPEAPRPKPSTQPQPAAAASPTAPAAVESAELSVNGHTSTVRVGGTFPENDPIFKLTGLTGRTAKVGIVGGTYASGSQTITLQKGGKPVTLMNTADGTTYVLRFVSVG